MSKSISPVIQFLGKLASPMLVLMVLGYMYAMVVARTEFSQTMFVVFMLLGVVALSLLVRGILLGRKNASLVEDKSIDD